MRQAYSRLLSGLGLVLAVVIGTTFAAAPASAADGHAAGELAATGMDGQAVLIFAIIAAVVIVAGVVFLLLRKRTPKE